MAEPHSSHPNGAESRLHHLRSWCQRHAAAVSIGVACGALLSAILFRWHPVDPPGPQQLPARAAAHIPPRQPLELPRAAVPSSRRTAEDADDSSRALACLRATHAPWKGARRYDNAALTLGDFLDEITRLYGMVITVNRVAFVAEGSDEIMIRSALLGDRGLDLGPRAHDLSVRTVLQRALDLAAQVPSGATIVPRKLSNGRHGWEVTTRAAMLGEAATVLHPVADLVSDPGDLSGDWLAEAILKQVPLWVDGEFPIRALADFERQPPILETVVRFLPQRRAVLVSHNWRVQEAVHDFLSQLRQARRTRGIVPALLLPKGDRSEGERLLLHLRSADVPWKGPARYDDPSFTLEQFLKQVACLHGISITVNGPAFVAEGLEEDKLLSTPLFEKPLNLGLRAKQLSLRTVLHQMLDRIPNVPSGVTLVPKQLADGRNGWEVTTGQFMLRDTVLVLHPVKDLVTGPGALGGELLAAIVKGQLPLWEVYPIPHWNPDGTEDPVLPAPALVHFHPGNTLQVTHNWKVQEAVLDFLNELRLARRAGGILPSALRPTGDVTESSRLLACLRDVWMPWKGAARYSDPDMTFGEFLREVARVHHVEIQIDAPAFLAEEREEREENVVRLWRPFLYQPLDLGPRAAKLSLGEVLRRVLERANTGTGTALVPKKLAGDRYGLEITTGEFMLAERFTLLHPVADLVARGWSEDQLVKAVKTQLPFWEGRNPITGKIFDPEKRRPEGGISVLPLSDRKVLLVTHNWWVQENVQGLLNQLRQTIRTGGAPPELLRPADDVPESSRLLACARASWAPWKGPRELDGSLSLRRFLQLVGRHHGVEVTVNEPAFEADCPDLLDRAIGKGKIPVNPKWSVRRVLLDVVKRLRGRGGVALVPRKLSERTCGWEVTTLEAAEAEQFTVLHPVGDLLTGAGALNKEQLMATVRGQLPLRERAVASVEFSPLAKSVVVSYNWRLQEQIDGYLNQLRQVRQAQKHP